MTDASGSGAGRRARFPRLLPHLRWDLLVCGTLGHEFVGHDAERLRRDDELVARTIDGVRWHRCLRCDSWLPLDPPVPPGRVHPPDREKIVLPLRGRPLRSKIILRLIAVNRAFHFVVLGGLGVAILLFSADRDELRDRFYRVVADLNGGPVAGGDHGSGGLLDEIDELFTLSSANLHLLAAVFLVYAVVEGVEAVGLWRQRRWAEYLTLVVTASLLPLEVYEIVHRVSPFKVVALVVNVAVVVYLLVAKRLFGVRGGARAEAAEHAADVGWAALERSAPGAGRAAVGR